MFKIILGALVCAFAVSGCGGGGGGAAPEPVSISVSQQSVTVAATTYGTPPRAGLTVWVDQVSSGELYFQGDYTDHGIESVSASSMGNSVFLNITFRQPSTLGAGVYSDTITIEVCRYQQCTQQVSNSPQQIAVTYTVTTGTLPILSALSPSTASRGGSEFYVTLTGTNFDSSSQVYWNGTLKPSIFVSTTQIALPVTAGDIAATGNYPVTVTNSLHPGVQSNAIPILITNEALSITKLSPTTVTVGNPAYTQTVIGTGFDPSSIVKWNGSARPTTYVSTTELLAQINATDVSSLATVNLTVTGTSTGVSNVKTVTISTPSIDATNVQTNSQHNSAINFANIVAPTAFPLSSKWIAELNGTTSNVLTGGGRGYVVTTMLNGDSELSAFSLDTGARLWAVTPLPPQAIATYDNGRVFVLSRAGTLIAYDATSGAQVWSTALSSATNLYGSAPTAANGMVYVTGSSNVRNLFAVDQANGHLAWSKLLIGGTGGSPTVTVDGVYVNDGCWNYAFRPQSGELIWSNNRGCVAGMGAGVGIGLTTVAANGVVYAHDPDSGNTGSMFDAQVGTLNSTYSGNVSLPAIGSTMGYFWYDYGLKAVRLPDGTTQWTSNVGESLPTAPILVNNYVFAYTSSNNVIAWDATTGIELWRGGTGSGLPFVTSPAVHRGSKVYAGAGLLFISIGSRLIAYTLSSTP